MEKRIRRQTYFYAIVAVLSAALLASLCYELGYYLQSEPSNGLPPAVYAGFLESFSSYEELRNFITKNSKLQNGFPSYEYWNAQGPFLQIYGADDSRSGLDYSTTNIQVSGVDEADIVKTDGEYIYLVSEDEVFILRAYPTEEAEVLSKIDLAGMYPHGIFTSMDRLVVLGSDLSVPLWERYEYYYNYYYINTKTTVKVYDVSNRSNPTSLLNYTISGTYFSSRMIRDYVYFVISQPTYIVYDTVILPKIYQGDRITDISPNQILHTNTSDNYYTFTTVVALNMQNTEEEPTRLTIMLGGTSSMYVSTKNIYVTFPETHEQTSIYRFRVRDNNVTCEAHGTVLGRELNQFSMDEHNDYFRIATTRWVDGNPTNSLHILDMNLTQVGKLEKIAPGETMDSARFIGDRCYLATSIVRRDPFFVIDLANASEPKILGYLKIPGFTRYLHPYDENHIVGVGRDEQNKVKIQIFDVSNVSSPINMSEYTIGTVWSDTPVLTEHKAFLIDTEKDLLVIPAETYNESMVFNWQGAYVFNITLEDGIRLKGKITHQIDTSERSDYNYRITRTFYIESVLYTVSNKKVKMNNLEDLTPVKEIVLP